MKIVMGAGSAIWNETHPALIKYGDDCIVFRKGTVAELVARIGEDRDVLVLTDNDPASFRLYDALASVFHSRRIHLFSCLPFTYESSRRKREILMHLGSLEMVRSLCLVELDAFLNESNAGETLGRLQLRIRNDMMLLLEQAIADLNRLDEFSQYRFDLETCSYRIADLSKVAEEYGERLNTKKRTVSERTEADAAASHEPAEAAVPQPENAPMEELLEEQPSVEELPEEAASEKKPGTEAPRKSRRSLFSFLRRKRD